MDLKSRIKVHNQRKRRKPRAFRRRTIQVVRSAKYLGRRPKQLVMVLADAIAMPAAFWTALTLRYGSVDHDSPAARWLYAASFLFAVPVFVRIGLYRAVIRFIGMQAALA